MDTEQNIETENDIESSNIWYDLDSWFDGRRVNILAGLALLQVLFAPMIDRLIRTLVEYTHTKIPFRDLLKGLVDYDQAGQSGLSAILGTLLFVALILITVSRAIVLKDSFQTADNSVDIKEGVLQIGRMVNYERKLITTKLCKERDLKYIIGVIISFEAIRVSMAFLRFKIWDVLEWTELTKTFIGKMFEMLWVIEGYVALLSFFVVLFLIYFIVKIILQRNTQIQLYSPTNKRIFASQNQIVTLKENVEIPKYFFDGYASNKLQILLTDLSMWKSSPKNGSEKLQQMHLYEYLRKKGYNVKMEFVLKIGNSNKRIDLVIDDVVAIELKYEFHKKNDADRSSTQIITYAQNWKHSGPVLLFLIATDPTHDRVKSINKVVSDWNQSLNFDSTPIHLVTSDSTN